MLFLTVYTIFIQKEKKKTYNEYLVNVLFFQIRPCHHSAIKVNFSLEAHFTQAQICGLHVVDRSAHNKIKHIRETPGQAGKKKRSNFNLVWEQGIATVDFCYDKIFNMECENLTNDQELKKVCVDKTCKEYNVQPDRLQYLQF